MTEQEWLEFPSYITSPVQRAMRRLAYTTDLTQFLRCPADNRTIHEIAQTVYSFVLGNFHKLEFTLEESLALKGRIPPFRVNASFDPWNRSMDVLLIFPGSGLW